MTFAGLREGSPPAHKLSAENEQSRIPVLVAVGSSQPGTYAYKPAVNRSTLELELQRTLSNPWPALRSSAGRRHRDPGEKDISPGC